MFIWGRFSDVGVDDEKAVDSWELDRCSGAILFDFIIFAFWAFQEDGIFAGNSATETTRHCLL